MIARLHLLLLLAVAFGAVCSRSEPADSCCNCSQAPSVTVQPEGRDTVCLGPREMRRHVRHFEPLRPSGLGKDLNIAGEVVVNVRFASDGKVTCASPESGHPIAVSAAMEALRRWAFKPVMENGVRKGGCGQITIGYRLRDKGSSSEIR